MWLSDVRYLDDAALAAWDAAPSAEVKGHLFGDIELIVDESTTYRAVGDNAHTYIDETGIATPQGPVSSPSYGIFARARSDEPSFRECLSDLGARWARVAGVLRLRLNLFGSAGHGGGASRRLSDQDAPAGAPIPSVDRHCARLRRGGG